MQALLRLHVILYFKTRFVCYSFEASHFNVADDNTTACFIVKS